MCRVNFILHLVPVADVMASTVPRLSAADGVTSASPCNFTLHLVPVADVVASTVPRLSVADGVTSASPCKAKHEWLCCVIV